MSPILVCEALIIQPGVYLLILVCPEPAPERYVVSTIQRIHAVKLQASSLLQVV